MRQGYLVFDTETTSLIQNTLVHEKFAPEVIEFYGERVEADGTVLEELEFMCKPRTKISDEVTNITGITNTTVEGCPPFTVMEPKVREILARSRGMVAHNLVYDWDVLNFEFKRCGTLDQVEWPNIRICTVENTEWIKGYRLKLSDLHEVLFNEPFAGAHRAKNDVKALTRCFVELKKRGDL